MNVAELKEHLVSDALRSLPLDHPVLLVCASIWETVCDGSNGDRSGEFSMAHSAQERQRFYRYGFDAPESGDAHEFLQRYLGMLKHCLDHANILPAHPRALARNTAFSRSCSLARASSR
jgi:hypothetical protein